MSWMETNYWLDDECARAFWDQHRALPYQELLQDTARLLDPRPGERWLDLGCGGGQLTAALWQRSRGQLSEIVAVDCAGVNAEAIARLARKLSPTPAAGQITFRQANFSDGLSWAEDESFDGIVSGLAISYAESRDPQTGEYTDTAYNQLLCELHRVLKPSGKLIFSVNVPEPNFWSIFWKSLGLAFRISKPLRVLTNALRMQRYGSWLRKEARRGRFHFFPLEELQRRLSGAGFRNLRHQDSYAGQAYLIYAEKPLENMSLVA